MKNLGVTYDSDFSFSQHISSVVRSCFIHVNNFRRIRKYLSQLVAISLANALVSSRLDYCNSLLYSVTQKELMRLQRVQNTICRIITRLPRQASITGALKSLHWLPGNYRIKIKLQCLTFKILQSGQPSYLCSYIHPYTCIKHTRRSDPEQKYLEIPRFDSRVLRSKNMFVKAFCHLAPTLWNTLPLQARTASALSSFRLSLKAHMFSQVYPP